MPQQETKQCLTTKTTQHKISPKKILNNTKQKQNKPKINKKTQHNTK